MSKFAKLHPGGKEILIKHAGKDATEAFDLAFHSEVCDAFPIVSPNSQKIVISSSESPGNDEKVHARAHERLQRRRGRFAK